MKEVVIFKADKKVKSAAQKVAKDLGIPLSVILNDALKRVAREKRITLESESVLNEKTKKKILRMEKDADKGKNMVGPFDSAEDFIKSLEE